MLTETKSEQTRRAFDAAAPVYDASSEWLPGIKRIRSITSGLYLKYFAPGSPLLELNCGTGNDAGFLDSLAGDLADLVRPGGIFIATVMPRFCLWETAAYLTRFQGRKAFRRLSRHGTVADLHGGRVATFYHSPGAFRRAFSRSSVRSATTTTVS